MGLVVAVLAVWVAVALLVLASRVRRVQKELARLEEVQRQRFEVLVRSLERVEASLARAAASREAEVPAALHASDQEASRQQAAEALPSRRVAETPPATKPAVSPGSAAPVFRAVPREKASPAKRLPPVAFTSEQEEAPQASRFEQAARDVLRRLWNWFTVGDQRGVEGTSYEFALATHWLVRIGVVILVLGIGFFLRYSIQQGWISEPARVILAATAGMLMIAGGTSLLGRRYHLLAQGLLGGGVAVLYFSVYAAANFYQLIHAVPTAFALMVIVAVLAGALAVFYDTLLMAVLGLLLGLLTPLVLHTGTIHYIGLNTYLLALGAGVIVVSLWKDWPVLYLLAFHGIYALVFFSLRDYRTANYLEVFPFLAGLFVLFSVLAVVRHLFLKLPSNLLDVSILLGNFAVLFFVGGWLSYRWLEHIGYSTRWSALLPAAMLLFYAAQAAYLVYARIRDAGLWAASVALAALAAAVVPVLVLGDHWSDWLMPSWAFQGTVILWLGLRLRSRLLPQLGMLFLAGALMLFVFLDVPQRANLPLPVGVPWQHYLLEAVRRAAPSLLTVSALAAAAWIIRHPPRRARRAWEEEGVFLPLLGSSWGLFVLVLGITLLVLGWEADRAVAVFAPLARPLGLTVVWTPLAAVLLWASRHRPWEERLAWALVALAPLVLKLLAFDLRHWGFGAGYAFHRGVSVLGSVLRLIDFALVSGVLLLAGGLVSRDDDPKKSFSPAACCGLAALVVLWLSLTLETSTWLYYRMPGFQAGGVSILWGAFALALLLGGMLWRAAPVRWMGLGLFAVVAVKVFLVDLRHLDAFYRIVAFVVLGLLVLAGSWLYMRHSERFQQDKAAPPGG